MAKPKKLAKSKVYKAAVARPRKQRRSAMNDPEIQTVDRKLEEENKALKTRVAELEAENAELRDLLSDSAAAELVKENEELRAKLTDSDAAPGKKKWQRGMLSSNEYIKIDPETGKFLSISKKEWDALV